MNRIILVALFALVAGAIDHSIPLWQFAGTTASNPIGQIALPTFDSYGNCTASDFTSNFQAIPLNITASGIYQIAIATENSFRSSMAAFLFNAAAPSDLSLANPCNKVNGFVLHKFISNQGGPVVNEGRYLTTGNYLLVIAGTSQTASGIFAVNIFGFESSSGTNGTKKLWAYPTDTCDPSETNVAEFSAYTFTATASGQYDIFVFFDNKTTLSPTGSSVNFNAHAALYNGTVSVFNTSAGGLDTCTINGGPLSLASSNSLGLILTNVTLEFNKTYTIIASGSESESGTVGFSVRKSNVFSTNTGLTWAAPAHGTGSACSGTNDNTPYFAYTFTAQYPTYILDTQQTDIDSFDTYSYLYLGTWNKGIAPPTCPIITSGDTGDQTPVAVEGLIVGLNYTIFVAPYNFVKLGTFVLYAFTGTQIGGNFTVPTNAATTGNVQTVQTTAFDPLAGAPIVTLTLEGNVTDFNVSIFIFQLSFAAEVDPARIKIISITQGSIIVKFALLSTPQQSGVAVLLKLQGIFAAQANSSTNGTVMVAGFPLKGVTYVLNTVATFNTVPTDTAVVSESENIATTVVTNIVATTAADNSSVDIFCGMIFVLIAALWMS